jgi:hypothetical protein
MLARRHTIVVTSNRGMLMRTASNGGSRTRCAALVGTLALTGCVPSGFVYDLPQDRYYSSGSSYYSAAQPGYYGQPVYYGQSGYDPRVVYVDHDHDRDDCRHESHRDQRPQSDRDRDQNGGRNDRGTREEPAEAPPPARHPRLGPRHESSQPAQAEPARNPCAGEKKCGQPGGETPEAEATPRGTAKRAGSRLVPQ